MIRFWSTLSLRHPTGFFFLQVQLPTSVALTAQPASNSLGPICSSILVFWILVLYHPQISKDFLHEMLAHPIFSHHEAAWNPLICRMSRFLRIFDTSSLFRLQLEFLDYSFSIWGSFARHRYRTQTTVNITSKWLLKERKYTDSKGAIPGSSEERMSRLKRRGYSNIDVQNESVTFTRFGKLSQQLLWNLL